MTHSKKGILMVTLFATLLSFANDASFYTTDAKRTALTLKDVKEGNLLSILDNNGVILYKESIQKTGVYTKGFDLTSLPDGFYLFELEKDFEIEIIPFNVKANNVTFNKEKEEKFFKPFTRVKDDLVLISQLALTEAPLEIKIFFSEHNNPDTSELIYTEKITNTQKIEKIFKLSGLTKGSYKIVCYSEGRKFVKIIN